MLENQNVFAQVIEKQVLDKVQFHQLIVQIENSLIEQYLKSFYAKIYTEKLRPRPDSQMKKMIVEIFEASGWKVKINNKGDYYNENFEFS